MLLTGCAVAPPAQENANGARARLPVPVRAAALLHFGPDAVRGALGAPDLRRAEGTAQVWLYAPSANCRVDVVFYPEADGPKVAHAVARVAAPVREDVCLQMVAARS